MRNWVLFSTGFSFHYAFLYIYVYIKITIKNLQEQSNSKKLILSCQCYSNILREYVQSLLDWNTLHIRHKSKKVMLVFLCSLYPESRDTLACNGYAISTWHHAFLIAFLQPVTSTSSLALLSVILIAMVSLTFSRSLLKYSLEGLLNEPRFELYGKKNLKGEMYCFLPITVLNWDACSYHIDLAGGWTNTVLMYTIVNLKNSIKSEELLSFLFCWCSGLFSWGGGCELFGGFCLLEALLPHWKGIKKMETAVRRDKEFQKELC